MEDELSDVFETARLQQADMQKIQAISTRLVPSEQEVRQWAVDQAIRGAMTPRGAVNAADMYARFILTGELPKEPTP